MNTAKAKIWGEKKMSNYNWKDETVKMLRMLRNSKTLKVKNKWSRKVGAGFIKDDIEEVRLNEDKTITIHFSSKK